LEVLTMQHSTTTNGRNRGPALLHAGPQRGLGAGEGVPQRSFAVRPAYDARYFTLAASMPRRLLIGICLVAAVVPLTSPSRVFGEEAASDAPGKRSLFNRAFRVFRPERYDPADPTQLNTYSTGKLQLNHLRTPQGRGLTYGFSLEAGYVLEAVDNYSLGFELPFLRSDVPGTHRGIGVGDVVINNALIPYRNEDADAFWNAGGILCSITAPTGDFDDGLGAGNWQLVPALALSFKLGPVRAIPVTGYQFAFAGSGQPGLDRASLSEGPALELIITGPLPDPWYTALTPRYYYDRLASAEMHSFSLRLLAGRLLGKRLNQAIELDITQELLQRFGTQTTVMTSYTYFF